MKPSDSAYDCKQKQLSHEHVSKKDDKPQVWFKYVLCEEWVAMMNTLTHITKHQKDIDDMIHMIKMKGWDDELSISTNPNFVRYFLKSKEWDIGDAIDLLQLYIKWRSEQVIGPVSFESVKKELATEKLLVLPRATDKEGNLLCFFVSGKHFPSNTTVADFIQMIIFVMETFLCSDQEYTGYTLINDMTDVRWANFDLKILSAMRGLQVLVYNAPYIFKLIWNLAKPLLSEHILSIVEVTQAGDLTNYIDTKNLPIEYGGELQVNYDQWLRDINALTKN